MDAPTPDAPNDTPDEVRSDPHREGLIERLTRPNETEAEAGLIERARPRVLTRFSRRELLAHGALGAFFLAVAGTLAATAEWRPDLNVGLALTLALAFTLVGTVEFEIGAGYTVPTQLVFVPMLFLLPAAVVPLLVALSFLSASAWTLARRRMHPARLLLGLWDAWHSVGPALVFVVADISTPDWDHWPWYVAALAAQFAFDVSGSVFRDWVTIGVRPSLQWRPLAWVYTVDALLAPVGLLAAFAGAAHHYAALLVLPLVALLAVFSRERSARIDTTQELSRAYRGTALLLGDVVESDDAYTGAHSRDVVELSVGVARALNLDEQGRREVEFTALLHDVGKIAIPKEIINKPGPLSADERRIIETHTVEGQLMLERVGGVLGEIGILVRGTHEHYDGGGYPDGLSGAAIPLAARIVCCCDAFSAMTTDRPYRAARTVAAAIVEVRACAGAQFDPDVVEALVALIEAGWDATAGDEISGLRSMPPAAGPPEPLPAVADLHLLVRP